MALWSTAMRFIIIIFLVITLHSNERIVTLSPALGEIVSGLGLEKSIVGVSDYSFYPHSLQNKEKVGGYFSLSLEKIIALKPTLVVGLPYQNDILRKLEHFNISTLSLKLERIEEIKKGIEKLGKQLNKTEEADALILQINHASKDITPLKTSRKVLIVFAASSGLSKGVYVAGHNLYFEEVLHLCGAQNAYTDTYRAQPVLHIENLIATNPDTVLLLYGPKDSYNEQQVRQEWQKLPINAAKTNSIKIIQSDYLLIPSQRISNTITTLCEAIK